MNKEDGIIFIRGEAWKTGLTGMVIGFSLGKVGLYAVNRLNIGVLSKLSKPTVASLPYISGALLSFLLATVSMKNNSHSLGYMNYQNYLSTSKEK